MKSAAKPPSDYERAREENRRTAAALAVAVILVLGLITAVIGAGCTAPTIPDALPTASAPSFDGAEQNSGVLSSTPAGFLVTPHLRDRYNALVRRYGADFAPPLQVDAGLTRLGPESWEMSKQAMVNFIEMNAWRRAGLLPKS
jgi:hypothetical protein